MEKRYLSKRGLASLLTMSCVHLGGDIRAPDSWRGRTD